ncbi:MAG: hypothetical protein MI919_30015, partial [Holophagales bacterium]|nr:hypothetical protein [Holophagales bacterium]
MATNDQTIDQETLERGTAEEIEAAQRLAVRYGVPYLDPDDFHMDGELFSTIPAKLMYRYNFIPLIHSDGVLTIVVSDPSDIQVQNELELALDCPIGVVVGTATFINNILK